MASKTPKPRKLAPGIYPVIDHVSPDIRDLLVYIEVDSRLAGYKIPEYGSKYVGPRGNTVLDPWADVDPQPVGRFDDHELVHVTLADERGMVRWYYARQREDQAQYNWQYTPRGVGGDGYPSYTRTYIVKRDTVSEHVESYPDPNNPAADLGGDQFLNYGDADPDKPAGPWWHDFVFAEGTIERINDENLDSLYVLLVRRFDRLCDKTVVTEDNRFGTLHTTTTYEFDDTVLNMELGTQYPTDTQEGDEARYIIDVNRSNIACSGSREYKISTIQLPSAYIESQRVDERFCNLYTRRWFDFNADYQLPAIGDQDPDDATRVVVEASREPIGQSDISEFTVTYGVFPTPPVSETREDLQYCRINEKRFYDREQDFALPSTGDTYQGETVIDAQSKDIACGDVREFSISTASIPTPVVTQEVLNRDYCRVISESNYDLKANIGDLPSYGDSHATDATFKVIEATIEDVGCGDLAKYSVSYATVPTDPVTNEADDDLYCRVKTDKFFDVSTSYTLPEKGTVYKTGYVIDAKADAVGCGDLYEYSISYAAIPTNKVVTESTSDEWCKTLNETYVDLEDNITDLPDIGTAHATETGFVVAEAVNEDLGCGGLTRASVTYVEVPSIVKTDEIEDDEFGKLVVDHFYELEAYNLPSMGDIHNGRHIVGASKQEINCGGVVKVELRSVTIPTLKKRVTAEDLEFCSTRIETNYELESTPLQAAGTLINGRWVLETKKEDLDLGQVAKYTTKLITLPTPIKESRRKDDDMCIIVTEDFYDSESQYTIPPIHSAHPSDGLLKLISTDKQPYGCGDIYKYTLNYAQIPTPPRTSEYDHPDYCRVSVDVFYDEEGATDLPEFGTQYSSENGTSGTVVEAKAQDVDCEGLRRYEIHYVTLPTSKQEQYYDERFCNVTRHVKVIDTTSDTSDLPEPGETYEGLKVISSEESLTGCQNVMKRTVNVATLPSETITTEREDDVFCTIQIESFYALSSSFTKSVGSSHGLGTVIDVKLEPMGCGAIQKVQYTTTQIPGPVQETHGVDTKYCNTITKKQVVITPTSYSLGDTHAAGGFVVDYSAEPLSCGDYYLETTETIEALPSEKKSTASVDENYCDITTDTWFDTQLLNTTVGSSSQGNAGKYVIKFSSESICAGLYYNTETVAELPSTKKMTSAQDAEFCTIERWEWIDLDTASYNFTRGDLAGQGVTGYCIDYTAQPLTCGKLVKHILKVADLPTEELAGKKINQITGDLEDFSTKIVATTDADGEAAEVDENGEFTVYEPMGCGLSKVKTNTIKPFDTLTYNTTINYTWPAVLSSVDLYVWQLRKGGTEYYPQYTWTKNAYSGPTQAEITEEWHKTLPAPQVPVVMIPTPVTYSCPLFRVYVPPCLHGGITFFCNFGSSHKKYKLSANSNFTNTATNYLDWPTGQILVDWQCRPAYGGFITKTVKVTAPV